MSTRFATKIPRSVKAYGVSKRLIERTVFPSSAPKNGHPIELLCNCFAYSHKQRVKKRMFDPILKMIFICRKIGQPIILMSMTDCIQIQSVTASLKAMSAYS